MPDHVVLIVDDDPSSRAVLRLICEAAGRRILEASTGEEALRRAVLDGIEVILLDIELPDMSGFEVCRRVRALGVTAAVLVVSADTRPNAVRLALESGADDYVRKPYGVRDLLDRLDAHLGGSRVIAPARRLPRHEPAS